jgi:lipopolysaccharide/colanic/teichoic acid biosynthesis glycosyltransferase
VEYRAFVSRSAAARSVRADLPATRLERFLGANRYVLGLALLVALALPEAVHSHVKGWGIWFEQVAVTPEPSFLMVAIAIFAGHVSLARLGVLPLVSARSLIVPTFLMTFGASMLVFLAAQVPIGRYHVWTSFVLVVAWYFLVSILRGRYLRPRMAMIGMSEDFAASLPGNVDWEILERPRLSRRVSGVVIDPHADLSLEWSRFITDLVLAGVPVYHRSQIEEGLTGKVRFHHHADNDFGSLLPSLAYLKLKRLLDLAGCAILLPLFLPVIAIACLLIRLESPGHPIFRQLRMGHRGRPFICFKLRTMRNDVEGPSYTLDRDPRITTLGRYLRKWRVDELPQIFNVLKGEMSWIGPRPEAIDLARHYARHVPFYDYRHAVRPGITGWAAVHQGNVAEVQAATEKLEYDFFYIRNFSPSLDFLIVLKTLHTIWSGFGSR